MEKCIPDSFPFQCACITVISKLRPLTVRQLRMIVKKAIDEHTLVADAVTFRLAAIAGIFISH